jgi:hypothetical protein
VANVPIRYAHNSYGETLAAALEADHGSSWRKAITRMRTLRACCSQAFFSPPRAKRGSLSGGHMSSRKPEFLGSTENHREERDMDLKEEISRLQQLVAELLLKNQRLRDAQAS